MGREGEGKRVGGVDTDTHGDQADVGDDRFCDLAG